MKTMPDREQLFYLLRLPTIELLADPITDRLFLQRPDGEMMEIDHDSFEACLDEYYNANF